MILKRSNKKGTLYLNSETYFIKRIWYDILDESTNTKIGIITGHKLNITDALESIQSRNSEFFFELDDQSQLLCELAEYVTENASDFTDNKKFYFLNNITFEKSHLSIENEQCVIQTLCELYDSVVYSFGKTELDDNTSEYELTEDYFSEHEKLFRKMNWFYDTHYSFFIYNKFNTNPKTNHKVIKSEAHKFISEMNKFMREEEHEHSLWVQCLYYYEEKDYENLIIIGNELLKRYDKPQYKGLMASVYYEHTQDKSLWKKSFTMFQELSLMGDSQADYMLGIMYEDGHVVPSDKEKAFSYLMKSANSLNAQALCAVGCYYERGWIVDQDNKKALEFYKKSVEGSFIPAYFHVANMFVIMGDIEMAYTWAERGHKLNDTASTILLGAIYDDERFKGMNKKKALKLYKKAADLGNHYGQVLYCKALAYSNKLKAFDLLHEYAANGNNLASHEISEMYGSFYKRLNLL